jgi:copper(I)-binding protein
MCIKSLAAAGLLGVLVLVSACQPSAPNSTAQHEASDATATTLSDAPADAIVVSDAWAAATPNGASVGGGYLTIANNSDAADALIGASSPRAPRVDLHEMTMQGNIMQMRTIPRMEIPAHSSITLASGSHHLMFNDITAPFVAGQTIPVTLRFEHHAPIDVDMPVRDLGASAPEMNMPGMGHGQH